MTTELCSDYELYPLVDYQELAKCYRSCSEGYPAAARDRPVVDRTKKWSITIMGDSTWNWKVTTKVEGSKAKHDVKSITRKITYLNATKIPLDTPSTHILCRGAFKCRTWLDGIPSVGGLAGWNREGKIF